jgi:hypothetical protein
MTRSSQMTNVAGEACTLGCVIGYSIPGGLPHRVDDQEALAVVRYAR